jgi:hypothetical protein
VRARGIAAPESGPLDAAYWHRRYEIERDAMMRAWRANDLEYALKNANTYWRAEANAIGFAARSERPAPGGAP